MLRFPGILAVREGEALALFEAIVWMRELGHTRVIFESYSQSVVNALHHGSYNDIEFGVILHGCNLFLHSEPYFKDAYVRRYANRAAHTLARQSYLVQNPTIGFASPDYLDDVLRPFCTSVDH
ncbi:hypothetical protein PTKIN_Ptkin01aG0247700 [Pterospermum kingtungense]